MKLYFNERKQLEDRYYEWVNEERCEEKMADSPFNVITFLQMQGLLDETRCKAFLKGETT